ncbi:hypothetical protein [Caulobacter endophyticus]|uniref:hypothetical protein n=1 Tax=Caulobacter endophyticus TaxID=2172652 RepID=UPI00240F50FE|nr:hypothetical protein [Caulobacter endophyticus]MDG2528427.1 hypothetical protein [Caulobacter endophyticus]
MTADLSFVRRVLAADAVTCAAAGALMALAAAPLAGPLGLPQPLLFLAGLSLFPVAALFAWMSRTRLLNPGLVWLAVAGNAGWVVGSLAVVATCKPTVLGAAFVLAQAGAVAVLAALEHAGLNRGRRQAHGA